MVISFEQIDKFVTPLYGRTWEFMVVFDPDMFECDRAVPVLRKTFKFKSESVLSTWVTQMLKYMQDVQVCPPPALSDLLCVRGLPDTSLAPREVECPAQTRRTNDAHA